MLLKNKPININPKISVVIPSYNQGIYIERTLLSILKQEYEGEIEVIVSDGGSTDDTVDILKKYDNRITWWSEKDSGYADAVNKGFQKATGEIFAIQSSDDYYLKNSFRHIIESFSQHPEASLICGRESIQEPDGHIFGGYTIPEVITPRSFLLEHQFPGIFQHTTFFPRKYYETVGGMRSEFDMCADTDLFFRILHFNNGYFINEYCAVYQKHDSQRTRTQILKFENQLLDMLKNCNENSFYNTHFTLADIELYSFKCFINLFYLQYLDPTAARLRANDLVKNLDIDKRTQCLAKKILDSEKINTRETTDNSIKKASRILTRIYKKYTSFSKIDFSEEVKMSFRDVIDPDWWLR